MNAHLKILARSCVWLITATGCERQQREIKLADRQPTEVATIIVDRQSNPAGPPVSQPPLPIPDIRDLGAILKEHVESDNETQGGAVAKIRALAPELVRENRLAATLQLFSVLQRAPFLDLVAGLFDEKRERGVFDSEYLVSVKWLNNTPFQPETDLLLEDLDRVPPYVFPEVPPNPWDAANAVHLSKGYPGALAVALVARDDAMTRKAYREKLENSEGALRRVMLWALGRSTAKADFDDLLGLFEAATGDEKTRIAKSLNRIPLAIEESLAVDPPADASTDPRVLLIGGLREQLESRDAVVGFGFWD